jgi:hypothetical protein
MLFRLTECIVDVVDVAVDVADADILVVVILAHHDISGSICIGSMVSEHAQLLDKT